MPSWASGFRNVYLLTIYLGFAVWIIRIVEPPNGYSPELLASVGTVLLSVGGVIVAGMGARAANKIADKWQPGSPSNGSSSAAPPSAGPPT